MRCVQAWRKNYSFSVFSGLLSSTPDFCVSSLLRGSNFRFLEMADWCNLGKDIASSYTAVLVAHRTAVLIWT